MRKIEGGHRLRFEGPRLVGLIGLLLLLGSRVQLHIFEVFQGPLFSPPPALGLHLGFCREPCLVCLLGQALLLLDEHGDAPVPRLHLLAQPLVLLCLLPGLGLRLHSVQAQAPCVAQL